MSRDVPVSARVRTTFNAKVVADAMEEATIDAVTRVTTHLQKRIKFLLNQKDNQSGNNPSRPGEPPAKVTGTLGRSWVTEARKAKRYGNEIILRLGSVADYAYKLEFDLDREYVKPAIEGKGFRNDVKKELARMDRRVKTIVQQKMQEREL